MDVDSEFIDGELYAPGGVEQWFNMSFCRHVMVERNGVILCWGGTKEYTEAYVETNKIFVFLPHLRNDFQFWFAANCRLGEVPEKRSGSSGVLIGSTLLIFGGYKKGDEIADPDEHNNIVVMPGQLVNDLYMLDLVEGKWSKKTYDKSEKRPTPRNNMCAWEYRGKAYFFGGYGYDIRGTLHRQTPGPFLEEGTFRNYYEARGFADHAWNNQLLMFDGISFSLVCQGGSIPSPRDEAACRRKGAVVYLFGGQSGDTRMNDLYRLDLSSFIWTQVETSNGPVGRSWASLDIVGPGRLLVWGGRSNTGVTGEPCSDLWMVDGSGGEWRRQANYLKHSAAHGQAFQVDEMDVDSEFIDGELYAPGGVEQWFNMSFCRHVMVERNGVILCWGGTKEYTEAYVETNKIFVFLPHLRNDFQFWFAANCRLGEVPEKRSGSSGVLIGSTLLIFGGYKKGDEIADPDEHNNIVVMPGQLVNDLYMLDLVEGKWSKKTYDKSEKRPTPRNNMCAWEYRGKAYFFGGYGYDIRGTLHRQTPGPFLEEGTFRNYYEARGFADHAWNNQLLMFDGISFSLVCQGGSIPSPRDEAACRRKGAVVYLFGGQSGDTRMNDLYRLDLSSFIWTQVETSNGPVGRSWASLDIVGPGRLLVWGGRSNTGVTGEPCSDLWMVDGSGGEWRRQANYLKHSYWHTSCLVDSTLFVVGGRIKALEWTANRREGGDEEHELEDESLPRPSHTKCVQRLQVSPPSLKVLSLNAVPRGYIPDCVPAHLQWQLRMHSLLQSDYSQCKWLCGVTLVDLLNYGSLSS